MTPIDANNFGACSWFWRIEALGADVGNFLGFEDSCFLVIIFVGDFVGTCVGLDTNMALDVEASVDLDIGTWVGLEADTCVGLDAGTYVGLDIDDFDGLLVGDSVFHVQTAVGTTIESQCQFMTQSRTQDI